MGEAETENEPVSSQSVEERIKNHRFGDINWTDIENLERFQIKSLSEQYKIHEIHLEECVHGRQQSQIEVEDDYIFLLLHFPFYISAKNQIAADRVAIFMGKNFIITIHTGITPLIKNIYDDFANQNVDKPQMTGYILYYILAEVLRNMASLIQDTEYEIDTIEDNVFNSSKSDALQIGQLRQKIVRLNWIVSQQNPVLNELINQVNKFTGSDLSRLYKQISKISHKLHGNIEEAKETVEIYKDADFITSTEKTNKILTGLTIIFTFSIPATVLGAFYGMNVNLPGGIEMGTWKFFGPYTTLIVIAGVSLIPALLMFMYFKKKRWL